MRALNIGRQQANLMVAVGNLVPMQIRYLPIWVKKLNQAVVIERLSCACTYIRAYGYVADGEIPKAYLHGSKKEKMRTILSME